MQALLAVVAREMHVPEDEVVDVVLGGIPAGIFDQRLGKRDVEFLGTVRFARLAAPPVPEAHRQVGMQQPRKEPAQRPRAEYRIEEFEHRLSVDVHVVAVGDEDVLPFRQNCCGEV